MAFSSAAQAGQQTAANPFGVMLSTIREATARRTKEDENRKKEEAQLNQALLVLGKKHEFDKALAQEKSDIEIKEKGTPITSAMRKVGLGTPEKVDLSVPSADTLLQTSGIKPRGRVATTSEGKEFFIPESLKEEKLRLDVQEGRREETKEGRFEVASEEAEFKAKIKEATDTVEAKTKTKLGILVSRGNLETVSGAISDLADVYIDSVKEGGAGGVIQKGVSKTAGFIGDLPQFLGGGEVGGKFPASGAYDGKKTETILKMMPMLTQQGLKSEGSVRIITGVLDALGATLPELGTAPKIAKRQFKETQLSFFRFARAAELLNMSFDEVFKGEDPNNISEEKLAGWINTVKAASSRIKIEGEEASAFEGLVDTALSRFGEIIKGDKGGDEFSQMSDEELRAIAGGR